MFAVEIKPKKWNAEARYLNPKGNNLNSNRSGKHKFLKKHTKKGKPDMRYLKNWILDNYHRERQRILWLNQKV